MAANRPACHHPLVVIPAKAGIHLPSLVLGVTKMGGQPLLLSRHAELVSGSIAPHRSVARGEKWMLKQVQHDEVN